MNELDTELIEIYNNSITQKYRNVSSESNLSFDNIKIYQKICFKNSKYLFGLSYYIENFYIVDGAMFDEAILGTDIINKLILDSYNDVYKKNNGIKNFKRVKKVIYLTMVNNDIFSANKEKYLKEREKLYKKNILIMVNEINISKNLFKFVVKKELNEYKAIKDRMNYLFEELNKAKEYNDIFKKEFRSIFEIIHMVNKRRMLTYY